MAEPFKIYILSCPRCDESREFKHVHDTAHGIAGTHMAGSERFQCVGCGWSIGPVDELALQNKLPFYFDGPQGDAPASALPAPPSGLTPSLEAALSFALEGPNAK